MSEPAETASPTETNTLFDERAYGLRGKLRELAEQLKNLHVSHVFLIAEEYDGQHAEMHANITLAYRHLEDATMRVGKAVQAYDGGKSIYPR